MLFDKSIRIVFLVVTYEETTMKNIKKLEQGKYEIYFSYVDNLTGKRRRIRRRIEGSLSDAVKLRDRLRAKAHDGDLGHSQTHCDKPLKQWVDEYLEHREHRDKLAASTLETERYVYEANVIPHIGEWKAEAIKLHHLDTLVANWLSERKDDGSLYSPTTIKNRVGYLARFLRFVFKRIGRNPAMLREITSVKKRKARKGRSLSPDEVKALFSKLSPFWEALAFTLLITGQRWGSVTALRWSDIGEGAITFATSHYRGEVKEGNKSGKTVRIPLPPALKEVLEGHRGHMMAKQRAGLETGLVFPARVDDADDASNNGYLDSASLRKVMRQACSDAGIPSCTPHDLRRTHNTWLVNEGVSGTVIRSITGHSSEVMTDHYYRGDQDAKADALWSVLSLVEG